SVTDPQGSVIPGATITLTNNATGERRTANSGADGSYRFVNLVPGNYKLEIESAGFRRYTRDQIEVNVDTIVRVDVPMQLGNLEQTVEVVGEVPILQTESAAVGSVVASRPVQELPLNGRNVLNLVTLAPGVVPQGGTEGSLTGKNVFSGGNYQIGGGTANQSATYFDGVPVNDGYGNIVALIPSPDAVSEFRVQTNSNSAEFGRFTGGVVNIASRSGSNNFHGNLYEYHRNKVLNANTFFGNRAGLDRPPFVQNQFGGSIGGPIIRDKLFFFGNYEGYRNREGVLFRRTVPSLAMYGGDFSGISTPIYDPLTQCGAYGNPACTQAQLDGDAPQRQQFPGNIIPANRINPVAQRFLDFGTFASPTSSARQQNFEANRATGGDNDQVNVRGDYNMTENNRLLVRYTRWKSANLPVDVFNNGASNGDPYSPERFVTTQAAVADTYTINPTTVLDVRLGFMRWFYDRTPGHTGIDIPGTFGLPQSPYGEIAQRNQVPNSTRDPSLNFSNIGYQRIGTGLIYAVDNTYIITPTLTKIVGRHTLKFGGELRRADINYYQNNNPGGTFTFNNRPTAANGASPGNTGDSFASFLLGIPSGGVLQISPFTAGGARYQGYFANDSWQVNQRLTLNLGVRWEIPGVYTERFDRQVSFNPNIPNPALQQLGITNPVTGQPFQGGFALVNSELHPERGLRPEKFGLFAPRVGVAFRLTDSTVLRAGGGVYFVPSTVNFPEGPTQAGISYLVNNIQTSADNDVTYFGLSADPSTAPLSNPFPSGIKNPAGRSPDYELSLLGGTARHHYRDESFPGYTQQWNLALQHQLNNGLSLEASYVGLQGKHLQSGLQMAVLPMEHITRAANDPAYASYLRAQVQNPLSSLNGGPVTAGQLATQTVQRGLLLRPFAQYQSALRSAYLGGNQYHSLQLRADKRFGAGAMISANYTFSKNTTNAETLTTWLESPLGGTGGYQTPNDLDREWALSSFDSRHRAVISYVLDLPFGQGSMFLNGASGVVDKLVSGWSVNGATTFQAGFPLAISATGAGQGWPLFGYGLRANVDPNCNRQIDGPAQDRLGMWFNTSCYSVPSPWTFGNNSRTDAVLRGHGINNWNMTLSKKTNITEQVALTFRAEAFNLFNRVQFGKPNQQANTAAQNQFGVVTSQVNQPRLFQLALRLTF
ncbi:MAG: carboxypeptidase regulatory-like domain-containing protein, partial [Candidatus Korobacteraceae bacterium]